MAQEDLSPMQGSLPKRKNWKVIFIAALSILLVSCFACLGLGAYTANTPWYKATGTARAIAQLSATDTRTKTPVLASATLTSSATALPKTRTDTPQPDVPSHSPTPTLDPNFNQVLTTVAGQIYATMTASVPTATSTSTPTPVAAVGDQVYLIPSAQGRPPEYEMFIPTPSPSDFILHPIRYDIAKLFSTNIVDDCDELMTRKQDYITFKFDQPRQVTRELICDGIHYYLIKGVDEWDFWVPEQLVSAKMPSPMGYIFHLSNGNGYGGIPDNLVHEIGDELEVRFQGQLVKVLFQGVEMPERGKVFYTTFTITNNGDSAVTVNPAINFDLMNKSSSTVYLRDTHLKTSWVRPLEPVDTQIQPGQSLPLTFAWEWKDHILWEFYLAFNAPIAPENTVRITDGAAIYWFDLEQEAQKAGIFQATPTP